MASASRRPQAGGAALAKFPDPPDVVFDAVVYSVRQVGGQLAGMDRPNRLLRFTDGAAAHTACVFPGKAGGCELECRAASPDPLGDAGLYARLAAELTAYLAARPDTQPKPPQLPPKRRRSERTDARRGFRCPYCGCEDFPVTKNKISTGGWVVFAVMLLVCFPLCFIGLLMTEPHRECFECGMKIGS